MKTKSLPDEKKWLLHNLTISPNEQERFIELARPIIHIFKENMSNDDYYGGYAVDLKLFKIPSNEYDKECLLIDESRKREFDGWLFFASKTSTDDCYVIYNNILMKHHLNSYLWFKNWNV